MVLEKLWVSQNFRLTLNRSCSIIWKQCMLRPQFFHKSLSGSDIMFCKANLKKPQLIGFLVQRFGNLYPLQA